MKAEGSDSMEEIGLKKQSMTSKIEAVNSYSAMAKLPEELDHLQDKL